MVSGLGVGALLRALLGVGKERMFEWNEFLAPATNSFARIAPKTPALDFYFVTFSLYQDNRKVNHFN